MKYWVTYWIEIYDNATDFSFEVEADTQEEAIQKIKDGKGKNQYQQPSRLARKFSATLI